MGRDEEVAPAGDEEAATAAVGAEVAAKDAEEASARPRRKSNLFWICRNTWTRRSGLNSGAAENVGRDVGNVGKTASKPGLPPGIGTLKGYDPLLNLVLDEAEEFLRGGT